MSETTHLREEDLDALLDERLAHAERARAEVHLAECSACTDRIERLRWMRAELRAVGAVGERDARLEARLRAMLDEEDTRASAEQRSSAWRAPLRPLLLVGALAATALFAVWVMRGPDLPRAAAERLAEVELQAPEPGLDAAILEARFRASGVGFPVRVIDLAMMSWRLSSGGVTSLGGREVAQIIYRDSAGRVLLCEMLEGGATDLPATGERFEQNGITFYAHRAGAINVVAWSEGEVLCMLVAAIPAEELRGLAVAKAMRPT